MPAAMRARPHHSDTDFPPPPSPPKQTRKMGGTAHQAKRRADHRVKGESVHDDVKIEINLFPNKKAQNLL